MNYLVTIFVFGFVSIFIAQNYASLIIKQISRFPHPINKPFYLQAVPKTDTDPLINFPGDIIIIQIADSHGLVKERVMFNYGLYDQFVKQFDKNYIKTVQLKINSISPSIDISVVFRNRSNLYLFEIYVISTTSKDLNRKMLNDLKLARRIYWNTIKLLKPSSLDLSFDPIGEYDNSWNIGDVVVASCRYYNGMVKRIPLFNNYQNLTVIESSFHPDRNERTLKFSVKLSNHFTAIQCFAGNYSQHHIIKVKHHPTEIYIRPDYKKSLEPNSTFECYSKDGYPSPKIDWILIDGPINASLFYDISRNGSQLHFNGNIPHKSKWTFICVIIHDLPKSVRKIKKKILFTANNCDINCMNQKMSKTINKPLKGTKFINNTDKNRNERLLKKYGKAIEDIEKQLNKTIRLFKQENYQSNFNHKLEIQLIKEELLSIKSKIESFIKSETNKSSKLLEIENNFKKNLSNHIRKIENQFNNEINLLKQENQKLKSSIKSIEQIKNDKRFQNYLKGNLEKENKEIKQLQNKFEQMQKFVEMKLIKKKNNLLCEYFTHVGEIVNKGQNSEINEWVIKNYKNLQEDYEDINSTSFYSHDWGYNLQLNLHPNGFGKGKDSYLSLFLRILPGEYDNQLVWPMQHSIKLSIRNQANGKDYFQKVIKFDNKKVQYFQKPSCKGNRFVGYQKFLMLDNLEDEEYLINDSLIITCELIK